MLTEVGTVALMLSISCGLLALVIHTTWPFEHDCGNRYCRHVNRSEDER